MGLAKPFKSILDIRLGEAIILDQLHMSFK